MELTVYGWEISGWTRSKKLKKRYLISFLNHFLEDITLYGMFLEKEFINEVERVAECRISPLSMTYLGIKLGATRIEKKCGRSLCRK
ncbi:hypothetical protein ACS0TY_024078 [Phlomoides rotata]